MEIIKNILDYNKFYKKKIHNESIGFVPTMGYLHDGHLSLIKSSLSQNKITIVSIFVNPTQFGKNEDYHSYPKDPEKDIKLLQKIGVDILFMPVVSEMYQDIDPIITFKLKNDFCDKLCGKFRPGHFEGVALIVSKLFSIIKPDKAYFGKKDYQQYLLIKNLAELFFPTTEIIGTPIIREPNGLAMSSRNSCLAKEEQQLASIIYKNLLRISNIIKKTNTINREELKDDFKFSLKKVSDKFQLEYFEIYDDKLQEIKKYKPNETFIGVAVFLNNVRLIDNIIF